MADFQRGSNRHRRIYGYERNPKIPVTFNDNGIERTFDRNALVIHRDYFLIKDNNTPFILNEYEELIVPLVDSDYGFISFQKEGGFAEVPIVTLEVDPLVANVNIFLLEVTRYGFTYGISSTYTGNILYRAISSIVYPTTVERTPQYPSVFAEVFAGQVNEYNVTTDNISFSFTSASIPVSSSITTINSDMSPTATADTYMSQSVDYTSSSIYFSSPYSGSLNYILIKS